MSYAADRDCSSCGTPSPFADVCGECEVAARVNAGRDKDEARIRAEAAAERTAAILEILRRHDLRDCSPGYLADTIEMAFPKPGGSDVP
jgi:hypothetical protein